MLDAIDAASEGWSGGDPTEAFSNEDRWDCVAFSSVSYPIAKTACMDLTRFMYGW